MSYSSEVLADSPAAFWRLGASPLVDASGNGNTLTAINAPSSAAGLIPSDADTCRDLNGTNQYYTANDSASLSLSYPLTIEAWLNPDALGAGDRVIVRKDVVQYLFRIEDSKLQYIYNDGTNRSVITTARWTATGCRYHCVVTDDGTNIRFYSNGILRQTIARPTGTAITDTSGAVGIGASHNAGAPGDFTDGRIDEVAIYPSALSAARILAHYTAALVLTDPYAAAVMADLPAVYYRMGEASGMPQDFTGNRNCDVVTGTPTYSQTGATSDGNTAIRLPGTAGNKFSAADHAVLALADTYTCEAWIKLAATGQYHEIFGKGSGAYQFRITNTGATQLVADSVAVIVTSTTTITDTTTWHHVAATKSGSTVKLYIDGIDRTGTVTNTSCGNTSNVLTIGISSGGANPANATLDELALYPTALSAARILAHYTAASGAAAPAFVPRIIAAY